PDPRGGNLPVAEVVKTPAFARLNQIGVSECPELALLVLKDAQELGASPLALGGEVISSQHPILVQIDSRVRGDPDLTGARDARARNGFLGQTAAQREPADSFTVPKAKALARSHPQFITLTQCQGSNGAIDLSRRRNLPGDSI